MQLIGGMKYERGIIGIDNGKIYVTTNENAPKGKIVTYDAETLSPASCAEFIPEQESVLTGAVMADHKFILTYDKDASNHPYLYDQNGKLIREIELPTFGSVGFSAKKDAKDREKGIQRLEKRFAKGKITKASVNNRGYNRLLTLEGETTVTIDRNKIAEDARLDGLKGYVTNSKIKDKEVVENYRNLFFIERAFRMNKTDLAIRPIYHRLFNRIEAHVCICFTAYTILLELERTLKKTEDKKNKTPGITIYRAKFLAESLYEIEYVNPYNGKKMSVMLRTDYDEEVVRLFDAIGLKP